MDSISALLAPAALMAIITLTFLEIILGIDNIVFLSIVTGKLNPVDRPKARQIGLFLALLFRILMLFYPFTGYRHRFFRAKPYRVFRGPIFVI
jgi:predicted tellurium resistance membrane protein TerC